MFGRLAKYYDVLYADKTYESEVTRLESIARRFSRCGDESWLDVACGTGRHLEILRHQHSVVGVDRSVEMLRIARRRLPGVTLRRADMRTFRLDARFDVVTCLFSAIGHLQSEKDLQQAFSNFARHVKPGGAVIVEPWIDPSEFHPDFLHLVTHRSPGLIVVRLARSSRKGNHSIIRYHYVIAEKGRRIRHFEEIDRGLLVSRQHLLRAMRRTGLKARFLKGGLTTGRGLILGVKPPRTPEHVREQSAR